MTENKNKKNKAACAACDVKSDEACAACDKITVTETVCASCETRSE